MDGTSDWGGRSREGAPGILFGVHMGGSPTSRALRQGSPHPSLLSSVSDYVIDDKVAVLQKRDHEGFGFVLRGAKGEEGWGGWGVELVRAADCRAPSVSPVTGPGPACRWPARRVPPPRLCSWFGVSAHQAVIPSRRCPGALLS